MLLPLSFAPSLIAAPPLDLAAAVRVAEDAGATNLHIDIMDGHFVPNLTYGPDMVKALRPATSLFLDVHLMVKDPAKWINPFRAHGADALTIHLEATPDWPHILREIKKDSICQAGLAINPSTDLSLIPDNEWDHIDRLTLMTVEPGFSGQSFIPLWDKIHEAALVKLRHPHVIITVDGGVGPDNIARLARTGIDLVVLGSAFYHQLDPVEAWKNLRALIIAESDL